MWYRFHTIFGDLESSCFLRLERVVPTLYLIGVQFETFTQIKGGKKGVSELWKLINF